MKEILSNVYHYNQQDEKMNGGGNSLVMMPLRYIDSELSIMDDTMINYPDPQYQYHYNNINTAAATSTARKKLTASRSSQSLSPSIRNNYYNNNIIGSTATSSLLITPFTGVRPSSAVSALSSASSTAALPMNNINTNTNTNVINLKKSRLNMSTSSLPFSTTQNNHNSNNTASAAAVASSSTVQGIAIHTPSHQLTASSSSAPATSNISALRKSTNTFSTNSLLLYPSTHSSTILNPNSTTNNNKYNATNVYNINNKSTAAPIIRNLSTSSIMKIPTTSSFQGNSFEISNNEAKNIYYAHYNGLEV